MIETDFWTQHYATSSVTEEYETDGFDPVAEAARIEAEEEAREAERQAAPGPVGGAFEGGAPPAPEDWEPVQ
jgi:hypothetical protein